MSQRYDIQHWLERSPWKLLNNTQYGIKDLDQAIRPELVEDPLLNQVIKMDMATFLIAEKHSMVNTAKMMVMAPDEESQIFLSTQVLDETRHFEVFSKRLADYGVSHEGRDKLMKRFTTPALQKFFDLIEEQMDKNHFIAGLVAQNLILEGMAYPIYRYEMKYWSVMDPGLSQIIRGAFADEVHHTSFGEEFLRQQIKSDQQCKNMIQKLVKQFHGLMTEVFETVIKKYISLYQAAANNHKELIGGIEIFPGRLMVNISEADQVTILLQEIQREFLQREALIGLRV
jgi:1,2-phenylacetyl-CoA epoxidase catalytic subunit